MVCASLGMAIVFVVPGTLWLKFVIAYAVSQIILLVRTVFEKTSVCNRISYTCIMYCCGGSRNAYSPE